MDTGDGRGVTIGRVGGFEVAGGGCGEEGWCRQAQHSLRGRGRIEAHRYAWSADSRLPRSCLSLEGRLPRGCTRLSPQQRSPRMSSAVATLTALATARSLEHVTCIALEPVHALLLHALIGPDDVVEHLGV